MVSCNAWPSWCIWHKQQEEQGLRSPAWSKGVKVAAVTQNRTVKAIYEQCEARLHAVPMDPALAVNNMTLAVLAKEAAFTELMDATESYLKHREELSTAIKQGVFSIAQAKYSASGPLGKTQYDMEMKATAKVNILCGQPSWSDSEDDADEDGPVPVPLFKLMSLTHCKSDDSSGSQAGPDSNVESDSASTMQQGTDRPDTHSTCTSKAASNTVNRGKVQAGQEAPELQAGIRQKGGVTTSDQLHQSVQGDKKQKDPLRWFGVLVPPSLRTAQAQFTSAVEHAVDLANARQRVLNAVKTWNTLQA